MEKGTDVIIKLSRDLVQSKLAPLAGREGVIVEVVANEKNEIKGCWVELSGESYENEKEWFFSTNSITIK